MSEFIDIRSDIAECKKFVDELGYDSRYIVSDLLKGVGQKAKAKSRSYYKKNGFDQISGKLYESIVWKYSKRQKNEIYIEPSAKSDSSGVKYGYVLASGHRVISKKKAAIYETKTRGSRWDDTGNVIRFKRTYDITDTPVNQYLSSAKYKSDLDKSLQKNIAKIEKRMGIKHEN